MALLWQALQEDESNITVVRSMLNGAALKDR